MKNNRQIQEMIDFLEKIKHIDSDSSFTLVEDQLFSLSELFFKIGVYLVKNTVSKEDFLRNMHIIWENAPSLTGYEVPKVKA